MTTYHPVNKSLLFVRGSYLTNYDSCCMLSMHRPWIQADTLDVFCVSIGRPVNLWLWASFKSLSHVWGWRFKASLHASHVQHSSQSDWHNQPNHVDPVPLYTSHSSRGSRVFVVLYANTLPPVAPHLPLVSYANPHICDVSIDKHTDEPCGTLGCTWLVRPLRLSPLVDSSSHVRWWQSVSCWENFPS